MTDPSYAGQIVTFTFPHIGNVGVNPEDDETADPVRRRHGGEVGPDRAVELARRRRPLDVADPARPDRRRRRRHPPADPGDPAAGRAARGDLPRRRTATSTSTTCWRGRAPSPGLEGMDLAKDVTCAQSYRWDEMRWAWPEGYRRREGPGRRVVAIDYGAKRNILRCLASAGCDVTVLPATATAEDVLAHDPEGLFLSNGPGDPAATGEYAVPMIREVLEQTRHPGLRHLPRPPDAGAGARRADDQDEPRPPRRQPSGEGARDRQGRDHLDEPRLHRRQPDPAAGGDRDPRLALRRLELRHRHGGPAGLLGAAPPRGEPRPAGQLLPVRALRRLDGARQAAAAINR